MWSPFSRGYVENNLSSIEVVVVYLLKRLSVIVGECMNQRDVHIVNYNYNYNDLIRDSAVYSTLPFIYIAQHVIAI